MVESLGLNFCTFYRLWGNEGVTPLILNLSSRGRCGQLHASGCFSASRKGLRHPLDRKLAGPGATLDSLKKGKISCISLNQAPIPRPFGQ
jgi:hypothetical protein